MTKPAPCWPRSMAGSPKASTPPIFKRPGNFSTNLIKNLDAARSLACSLRAAIRAPLVSFTEGFDTADLKDANALLDELSRQVFPTL